MGALTLYKSGRLDFFTVHWINLYSKLHNFYIKPCPCLLGSKPLMYAFYLTAYSINKKELQ
jgi:hypothetical protein